MKRPSKPTLYALAFVLYVLGATLYLCAASHDRCTCVLGGHYDNPSDPADCAIHGAEFEQ